MTFTDRQVLVQETLRARIVHAEANLKFWRAQFDRFGDLNAGAYMHYAEIVVSDLNRSENNIRDRICVIESMKDLDRGY